MRARAYPVEMWITRKTLFQTHSEKSNKIVKFNKDMLTHDISIFCSRYPLTIFPGEKVSWVYREKPVGRFFGSNLPKIPLLRSVIARPYPCRDSQ